MPLSAWPLRPVGLMTSPQSFQFNSNFTPLGFRLATAARSGDNLSYGGSNLNS